MLLPFQGANPNVHRPRALPWAGCLLAFQAVTPRLVYRTPIIFYLLVSDNSRTPHMNIRNEGRVSIFTLTQFNRRCVIMSKLLRCSSISDLVMYFSTLPSSSISAPCILLTLAQLKRVCRNEKFRHTLFHILTNNS